MKSIVFVTIFLLSNALCAQDKAELKSKDIPGSFAIDFGFNIPTSITSDFSTRLLGSRTVNIHYYYGIKIPGFKSHLSFNPGIGLGLDRFKFGSNTTFEFEGNKLEMSDLGLNIIKSQLITNYFDIPLDLRYDFNPDNEYRTGYISIGFKGGVLLNGYTKIKHTDDDGQIIKDKSKQDWNLNKFRYGITAKLGVGNFGLFSNYYLSTLFNKNSGPSENSINKITIGISLSGF